MAPGIHIGSSLVPAALAAAELAAARILKLSPARTRHALALAFNRCGGSFQSNIDGSLAVRAIPGWVVRRAGRHGHRHRLAGHLAHRRRHGLVDLLDEASAAARRRHSRAE